MKNVILFIALVCSVHTSYTQVGINTESPEPSAALDINATDKGLLIPRVETSSVASPATGLMVYQPSDNGFYFYNGTEWQKLGTVVQNEIADADGDTKIQVEKTADEDIIRMDIKGAERLSIISDSSGRTRIEWPDNRGNIANGLNALAANTFGKNNIANGLNTLENNTTGGWNIALGTFALRSNVTGFNNLAFGFSSLTSNTTGNGNIAHGTYALSGNSTGAHNIAQGYSALGYNSSGNNNIAQGYYALGNNSTGSDNIALGYRAGFNTFGYKNIMIGAESGFYETGSEKLYIESSNADSTAALIYGEFDNDLLRLNAQVIMRDGWTDADGDTKIQVEETADDDIIRMDIKGQEKLRIISDSVGRTRIEWPNNNNNIANGYQALKSNIIGIDNIANGYQTLVNNRSGNGNIATGIQALTYNTTGNGNIAYGYQSQFSNNSGTRNIALGSVSLYSNVQGSYNIALGFKAGYNALGDDNVFIGRQAGENEIGSDKLYIENTSAGSTDALIYGEFDNDLLQLNANVAIGTTPATGANEPALVVNGKIEVENKYVLPDEAPAVGEVLMAAPNGNLIWIKPNYGVQETVTFSTPGTYTWTCPEDYYHAVFTVKGSSGGGGGGGAQPSGTITNCETINLGSSNGGSGGQWYQMKKNVSIIPGDTYTIVVGERGLSGSIGNDGTDGGTTSVTNSNNLTIVSVTGGGGGTAGSSANSSTGVAPGGIGGAGGSSNSTGFEIINNGDGYNGADCVHETYNLISDYCGPDNYRYKSSLTYFEGAQQNWHEVYSINDTNSNFGGNGGQGFGNQVSCIVAESYSEPATAGANGNHGKVTIQLFYSNEN